MNRKSSAVSTASSSNSSPSTMTAKRAAESSGSSHTTATTSSSNNGRVNSSSSFLFSLGRLSPSKQSSPSASRTPSPKPHKKPNKLKSLVKRHVLQKEVAHLLESGADPSFEHHHHQQQQQDESSRSTTSTRKSKPLNLPGFLRQITPPTTSRPSLASTKPTATTTQQPRRSRPAAFASSMQAQGAPEELETSDFWADPQAHVHDILTPAIAPLANSKVSTYFEGSLPNKSTTSVDNSITSIPCLDHSCLHIGNILEEGDFYQVYEIASLRDDNRHEDSSSHGGMDSSASSHANRLAPSLSHSTPANNLQLLNRLQKRTTPWSLKCVHADIIQQAQDENKPQQFENAATKLILEGLYLSQLQHPHILKLAGYGVPASTMSTAASPYQQIFLMTERLGETLAQRLDKWKQLAQAKEWKQSKQQQRRPATGSGMMIKSGSSSSLFGNSSRRRKQSSSNPNLSSLMSDVSSSSHRSANYTASSPLSPNKKTVKQLMKEDPTLALYPEDMVALKTNYALQILQALDHLHQKGIVLRELRPGAIGFLPYPHHHHLKLTDLSSCRELTKNADGTATDDVLLAPEMIRQPLFQPSKGSSMGSGASSGGSSRNLTMMIGPFSSSSGKDPSSAKGDKTRSLQIPPLMVDDSELTTASQMHTFEGSSNNFGSAHSITSSSTANSTNNGPAQAACLLLGVSSNSVVARRYMAPEIFTIGYSYQADLYSWAVVFSEMLMEAKPYSSRQLSRDWAKIVEGDLRPKIQKYHFPRTLKAVLEQAWHANPKKRSTAHHLEKSVSSLLHVLEGKGLPWQPKVTSSSGVVPESRSPGSKDQESRTKSLSPVRKTGSSRTLGLPPKQFSSKSLSPKKVLDTSTPATPSTAISSHDNFSNKKEWKDLSLPERACCYRQFQERNSGIYGSTAIPWSDLWDSRNHDAEQQEHLQAILKKEHAKTVFRIHKDLMQTQFKSDSVMANSPQR